MSVDVLQFLKNKFENGFQEAVDEATVDDESTVDEIVELPLRSHFHEILKVLQEKKISPSTPLEMKNWLHDLNYALAECVMLSEKLQKRKAQDKKTRYRGLFPNEHWFIFNTQRKLLRIKKKLEGMSDSEAASASSRSSSLITVGGPENLVPFDGSNIHGMDEKFQNIEAVLLETPGDNIHDDIKAIGLVGMGGSGKTALARMVYESLHVRKKFFPRIWISLSERLNLDKVGSRKEIVYKMLEVVGNSGELTMDSDLDELLSNLRDGLSGRKYLIVLDNMWHVSDWYSGLGLASSTRLPTDEASGNSRLSFALPKGSGGAIIVTSRLEKVASSMVGDHNLLRIHPTLDAETCWDIFMDSIKRKSFIQSNDPTLLRMKDEIADHCDGLPLAAKTLAEIISFQISQKRSLFWSDPTVNKEFNLRLDTHDLISVDMARDMVRELPGVDRVDITSLSPGTNNEIKVLSRRNPKEIVIELSKFFHTELISVDRRVLESERGKKTQRRKLKK